MTTDAPEKQTTALDLFARVPFFSPDVERQVLVCLDFIAEESTDWLRELFQVALGAVMVGFSNYSYEPSLGTRAAAGKPTIDDADVISIVRRKLQEMREDILNNYHYIRNTRPHMFWLGMVGSPADLKIMERKSFGQFWQTVLRDPGGIAA